MKLIKTHNYSNNGFSEKISILILTHNAPTYVEETISSLNEITRKEDLEHVEIVVLDNASEQETVNILHNLKEKKYITKLILSEKNTLFSGGNNIAAKNSIYTSDLLLLLNSDVRINNKNWLRILVNIKRKEHYTAASYGYCKNPDRGDGYCFLVDRNIYMKNFLSEEFQWWWSLTKFQADLLKENHSILAIDHHDHIIYHYGGKSGKSFIDAKGMDTSYEEVVSWFNKNSISVVSLSFTKWLKFHIKKISKSLSLKNRI